MYTHYYQVDVTSRMELFNKVKTEIEENKVEFKINKSPWYVSTYAEIGFDGDDIRNAHKFKIHIGRFAEDKTNIVPVIALAHELGHYYDITRNHGCNLESFFKSGTLHFELKAWEIAVDIFHKYGFKEWNAFREYALFCLSTYAKVPERFVSPKPITFEEIETRLNNKLRNHMIIQ